MAWTTGPHAEAPQDVLCYGGPDPGTVVWYVEDAPGDAHAHAEQKPPPPPPASQHPPQANKHG